jgi:hypothetical protein
VLHWKSGCTARTEIRPIPICFAFGSGKEGSVIENHEYHWCYSGNGPLILTVVKSLRKTGDSLLFPSEGEGYDVGTWILL